MVNELVSKEHPRQRLIFFVAEDVDDEKRAAVKKMITDLAPQRKWVIGPPSFIDVVDDAISREGDEQDETLGGIHEIYSAYSPNDLPREVDLLHLAEVEQIVRAVQRLSLEQGIEFEFELDGRFVGAIENGDMDSTLQQGLLGEWHNHLA
ncbi:hypothetical protein [Pseudoduganella sp. R-34]|uniref:hypothetical protein n=1 Tax=Pseudoduganella sp. R-34 TaxID=3404062 RepID=UPI003CEF122C